jgi:hypothetical protein
MALFVVLSLGGSAPAIKAGLDGNFPNNYYQLEEDKWIVSSPLVTAKQVSDAIGISNDLNTGELTGFVASISGYFGRGSRDMWEWIAAKSVKPSA